MDSTIKVISLELQQEHPDSNIIITHYEAGMITINHTQQYTNSLILSHDAIINDNWLPAGEQTLSQKNIQPLLEALGDIFILGMGPNVASPPVAILQYFAEHGKPLDFMSSQAACRTFNILAGEGRPVVAAIVV